jgi:hypothetical protein
MHEQEHESFDTTVSVQGGTDQLKIPMTKASHYVPRFLLRHFCGDSGSVYVHDLIENKVRQQKPDNIAFVNRLYELEFGVPDPGHVEQVLARIEGATSRVVAKVLRARDLSALSQSERLMLLVFIAVQLPRVYKIRSYFEHLMRLPQYLRMSAAGVEVQVVKGLNHPAYNQIALMKYAQTHFTLSLAGKVGVLLTTREGIGFCISDNPVAIYNTADACRMVNLAAHLRSIYAPFESIADVRTHLQDQLDRPGAEVYMPLSSDCCLLLLDVASAARAKVRADEVLEMTGNEVRTLNWLQAYSTQRFLFARDNDFNVLVEDKQYEDEGERVINAMKQHFVDWNVLIRLALHDRQDRKYIPERNYAPFCDTSRLREETDAW